MKKTAYPLRKFRGVKKEYVDKLAAFGIRNINQMLDEGQTPEKRQQLAAKTGIPHDAILEFEVSIKTAADVLLGGDAASAYLSGEVTATGNIAQALILQELLELFLELLPFTN